MELLLLVMSLSVLAQDEIAPSDPGPAGMCCPEDAWRAGELLVSFRPGTTLDTVAAIAAEVGATVLSLVGDYSYGVLYKMGVPPGDELEFILLFEAYFEVRHAEPNYIYCVPEAPPCECCPPDLTCRTLPPCIYLGEVSISLSKSATYPGDITINWVRVCGDGAANFGIYEGPLGSYDLHRQIDCYDESPYMTEEITPDPEDCYYLVVPRNSSEEASYGTDSSDQQRPRGLALCVGSQLIEPECP